MSKLASSMPSPAFALVKRTMSALYFSYNSLIVKKLPLDFDIFSLLTIILPLIINDFGQCFFGNNATWLNMQNERWFWTRSFAEFLKSKGYQYSKSFLIFSIIFFGMPVDFPTASIFPFPR